VSAKWKARKGSTNVIYRLDTESARAFLYDFVALPQPG
jgi:hypothetical protein